MLQQQYKDFPNDPIVIALQNALPDSYTWLGTSQPAAGDFQQAEKAYQLALPLIQKLPADDGYKHFTLAEVLTGLGEASWPVASSLRRRRPSRKPCPRSNSSLPSLTRRNGRGV